MKPQSYLLAVFLSGFVTFGHLLWAGRDGAFNGLPPSAFALSGNYYASASESGGTWGGVQARWDIQDLYAPDFDAWGFALQDLWAVTNTAGERDWVEVGYAHGWQRDDIRIFFWVEQIQGWGYKEYRITSPSPGPPGNRHWFRIERTGTGGDGQFIYKVFIDDTCVEAWDDGTSVGCESWQNPGLWVKEMSVGAEATHVGAQVGPTNVREMRHKATDSAVWSEWSPGSPSLGLSTSMFEWYGNPSDYKWALYGMGVDFRDDFEGPDGSDPSWPKDPHPPKYWNESGGNIFIHYVLNDRSHVHTDYSNSGGYLLMRRPKDDSHTGSPIVVQFGFGEDLANAAGRFFGVWTTNDSTQMGIGVHTGQWSNTYFYRPSNSTSLIDTGIARTSDWHVFRFYIRYPWEGCSYGELDGTSLAYLGWNCDLRPDTLSTWGIASAWGLTDPPSYDGIWDNAVYFHR